MAATDINLDDTDTEPKKSKKLLILAPVVLLVVVAAYWFFFLKGGGDAEAAEPEAGETVALEPIQVNLAEGRYLRVGIAMEMVKDVADAPEGSKALNYLIEEFSGDKIEDVLDPEFREEARLHLAEKIGQAYDDEVLDIYYTDFVAQ